MNVKEIFEKNGVLFASRSYGLTTTSTVTFRAIEKSVEQVVRDAEIIHIVEQHGDNITACKSFLLSDKERAFQHFKMTVQEFESGMDLEACQRCYDFGEFSDGGFTVKVLRPDEA